jgi:hypothetical protein
MFSDSLREDLFQHSPAPSPIFTAAPLEFSGASDRGDFTTNRRTPSGPFHRLLEIATPAIPRFWSRWPDAFYDTD